MVSATQLSMFETCPRQWWAFYVKKIERPPPTEAIKLGLASHKILELSLLAKQKGFKKYSDPLALIKPAAKEHDLNPADIARLPILLQNATKMGWYDNYEISRPEFEMKYKIGNVGVIIRVDRQTELDDLVRIVDIKSGKYPYEQEELYGNWQTRLYSLPFLESKPVSMEFWFIRFFHKKPTIILTSEDRKIFLEDAEKLIERMFVADGSEFKENRNCRWCAFKDECIKMRKQK